MKKIFFWGVVFISVFSLSCLWQGPDTGNYAHYNSFSRLTDPKDFSFMLQGLPDGVLEICEIAKRQTVHHNLLPYFGIPSSKWREMNRIWSSGAPIP